MARARGGGGIDTGIRVEGLREKIRALEAAGVSVTDLKEVFGGIAKDAARLAASKAPRRTGRLAASIKGSRAKNKAVVRAGRAKVPYAGAVNYGWPARNIAGRQFMQKADKAIRPTLRPRIDTALRTLMREKGLV